MNENVKQYHEEVYILKIHKVGTLFMMIILVLTFVPALYLSFVKGYHPGWEVIGVAFVAMVGLEIMVWIMEPLVYFPLLGVTGSYLAFVTGNVTNVRIPSSIAAQNAIQAENGTERSEVAGVYGMIGSVFVNFFFLFIVVFFGIYILEIIPEFITDTFKYIVPCLFGGILSTFVLRVIPKKKQSEEE